MNDNTGPKWEQNPLKTLVNLGQSMEQNAEQITNTFVSLLKKAGFSDTEISDAFLKWVV